MNEKQLKDMLAETAEECPYKFNDVFDYSIEYEFDDILQTNNIVVHAKSRSNNSIYSLTYSGITYVLSATIICIENIPRLDDTEIARFFYEFSKHEIHYRSFNSNIITHGYNSIFSLMSDLTTKFDLGILKKGWPFEIEENVELFYRESKVAFNLLYKFNQTLFDQTQLDGISLYSID